MGPDFLVFVQEETTLILAFLLTNSFACVCLCPGKAVRPDPSELRQDRKVAAVGS